MGQAGQTINITGSNNDEEMVDFVWITTITDNGQDLTAVLNDKILRNEEEAKSLSEGYGAGLACINRGMDCIISKIEEAESLLGGGGGKIGVEEEQAEKKQLKDLKNPVFDRQNA